MGSTWAFAVLVLYPLAQVPLLWLVVSRFDLRNDDGPRDPVGYAAGVRDDAGGSGAEGVTTGRCTDCGLQNDPVADFCRNCLAGLSAGPA